MATQPYISNYEKKWGNTGSDVNILDVADNPTPTPTQPLSSALGMGNPYQVTQKPNVLGQSFPGSAGVTSTQSNTAPVVPANTSDVNAQVESMKASLANIQKEADKLKAQETPTPKQPQKQSSTEKMWASLMGKQGEVQNQVTQSQQNLLAQQNAIYEKWGLTPENYQKIQGLTAEIGEYQKQMADLDTREAQAVDNAQNRAGTDLAFASGETARIQRAYAIQKSGIAANASILASEAQALQGNWDSAMKSANLYVDNATKAQQQTVSDLKWGFENYKDIISSMSADEQKRINDQLDYQSDLLKQQQDDKWKEANYKLDLYKAQKTGTTPTTTTGITPQQQAKLGTINDINTVLADSAFSSTFGLQNAIKRNIPGTPEYNVKLQVENLIDTLALTAREQLKGQGTVSDFEGKMLKNAQTALKFNMSPEQAMQELVNVKGAIATSSGLTAKAQLYNPKTGESALIDIDQAGINQAIKDGMQVAYSNL